MISLIALAWTLAALLPDGCHCIGIIAAGITHNATTNVPSQAVIDYTNCLPPHGDLLKSFMVTRPPGSPNHQAIQKMVQNHFEALGWHFEVDRFTNYVRPLRRNMEFTNLIATANPQAARRLVLAAHYDSKMFLNERTLQGEGFLGATDSAWSCAFLLQLASMLSSLPRKHTTNNNGGNDNDNLSLQIVLFDGEESVSNWSSDDSIYGARHLAQVWSKSRESRQQLNKIKALVLLDLLGAKDCQIYSYYDSTAPLFRRLHHFEEILRGKGALRTRQKVFIGNAPSRRNFVDDDHSPFLARGVPILHLIPSRFPPVWHKMSDDMSALDHDYCHDIALILHYFVAEQLQSPQQQQQQQQ